MNRKFDILSDTNKIQHPFGFQAYFFKIFELCFMFLRIHKLYDFTHSVKVHYFYGFVVISKCISL